MHKDKLKLDVSRIEEVNQLLDPDNPLIRELLRIVAKYGTPEEINRQAREARDLTNIFSRLEKMSSPYLKDLEWLMSQRDKGAFISISDYRAKILGDKANQMYFNEGTAVTLEISALQYFPWLITEARQAIEKGEIMPGRYIRVRNMAEQERDQGDILAVTAAMQIIGASYVESLNSRGTDGSNVHLGGPETITGYFGGIGQPNEYPLKWADELLYYYTNYGISQVLNINFGTILLGYLLYRLGIDISFKISVFTGHDNPFVFLWTLMMARLFAREDGSTPLAGLNVSNSVNNWSLEQFAEIRQALGLESHVLLEHHITETYQSIVRQPYLRRDQLVELATKIARISAKHEGGDPDDEANCDFPSSILHYFRTKEEIEASGDMPRMEKNYMMKHDSLNKTARALTENGLSFVGAKHLHRR